MESAARREVKHITKTSVPLGEEVKATTLAIIIKTWGEASEAM